MTAGFRTDYGTLDRVAETLTIWRETISGAISRTEPPALSYSGKETIALGKTSSPYGQTYPEIKRARAALNLLRSTGRPCIRITLGDAVLDMQEWEARELADRFQGHLRKGLQRHGLPAWIVRADDSKPSFHPQFVTFSYPGIERLRESNLFASCLVGQNALREVDDWQKCANYITGERTPQAHYAVGGTAGPRVTGSHRMERAADGELQSPDRVRLSVDLLTELKQRGALMDYRRSYARTDRSRSSLAASKVVANGDEDASAPKVGPARSVAAAPLQRTGTIQAPPMVPIIEDHAGQLGFVLGEPDNIVIRLDEWRKAQGVRQEDIAAAMGISRPTYANARAGRYRLSGWALSRAAELLRAS